MFVLAISDSKKFGCEGSLTPTHRLYGRHLEMNQTPIDPAQARIIAWAHLPNLLYVELYCCSMGLDAIKQLVRANWPVLKSLSLGDNKFGDAGVKLLKYANWPCLEKLTLYKNKLTAQSAQELAFSHWKLMEEIILSYNRLGDDGLFILLVGVYHKKLKKVFVRDQLVDTKWLNNPPRLGARNLSYRLKIVF